MIHHTESPYFCRYLIPDDDDSAVCWLIGGLTAWGDTSQARWRWTRASLSKSYKREAQARLAASRMLDAAA